ncbi:hypothetical protein [Clostridium sp.]|uniref:hypothetical protein n=1 Tax=Clostridium sp. TaxID=1506 RepID=UPI002FC77114
MSDYRMDISGEIKLSDYSSIHDYMGIVGPDDNFTIVLDSTNDEDAKVLCSILESDKFTIFSRGGKLDGRYFIRAFKRK